MVCSSFPFRCYNIHRQWRQQQQQQKNFKRKQTQKHKHFQQISFIFDENVSVSSWAMNVTQSKRAIFNHTHFFVNDDINAVCVSERETLIFTQGFYWFISIDWKYRDEMMYVENVNWYNEWKMRHIEFVYRIS